MFLINDIVLLFKEKKNDLPISEMVWVAAGQSVNVILGFFIIKILSRMGIEDYGIYALLLTFSAFIGLIFYGPLLQGFIRFYFVYASEGLAKVYSKFLFNNLLISFLVLMSIAILIAFSNDFFSISFSSIFIITAGAFIILTKISETFNSLLNLLRKRKENAAIQTFEKIGIIALLFFLVNRNELNISEVILILLISALAFGTIKIFLFKKHLPIDKISSSNILFIKKSEMKQNTFMYMLPFLIWGISGWLQSNGERWIINGMLSIGDVGVYAVMMSLVNALVAIPNNILADFATPIIFNHYSDLNDHNRVKMGFRYISLITGAVFLLSIIASVITAFFGKSFIELISSESYSGYWYLLPFFCLGMGLYLTGQAQAYLGMALNLPQKYLLPKILIGLLSISLNFLLIKFYGLIGIAYTLIISGIFYSLHIIFINRKIISKLKLQ